MTDDGTGDGGGDERRPRTRRDARARVRLRRRARGRPARRAAATGYARGFRSREPGQVDSSAASGSTCSSSAAIGGSPLDRSAGRPTPTARPGPLWVDVLFTVASSSRCSSAAAARWRAPLVAIAVVFGGCLRRRRVLRQRVPRLPDRARHRGLVRDAARTVARRSPGGRRFRPSPWSSRTDDPQTQSDGDYFWSLVTFTIAWIIGFALGERLRETDVTRRLAEQAELEREEQARLAVAEERARIARELHDVVGHSVSVMTVQAAAVRRLLEPDQDKEREALEVVEQTGREALAEMRRMVGVLRRPEEAPALAPQPSLEHLEQAPRAHARGRAARRADDRGHAGRAPAGARHDCLPDRPGGSDQRGQARERRPGGGPRPLRERHRRAGRQRRRPGERRRRRQRARAGRDAGTGIGVRGRARGRPAGGRWLPAPCDTPRYVSLDESATTTLTFLFTDIDGSTALLRKLRDDYSAVFEDHRRLLRDAWEAHGGRELDNEGDSFFVAFRRPRHAVDAAVAAQRALAGHSWPEDAAVRVRIGVHTGEATATGDHYVGLAVHRAARICDAGHGGQVLLSETTRSLLEDDERDLDLHDLGPHQLKDFDRPVRIYQLAIEGLHGDFPPLRTQTGRDRAAPRRPPGGARRTAVGSRRPRPDRRRPGSRPHRLPDDPRGRARPRGRRRGLGWDRGGLTGPCPEAGRRADGRAHAGGGRDRGDAAAARRRRRRGRRS